MIENIFSLFVLAWSTKTTIRTHNNKQNKNRSIKQNKTKRLGIYVCVMDCNWIIQIGPILDRNTRTHTLQQTKLLLLTIWNCRITVGFISLPSLTLTYSLAMFLDKWVNFSNSLQTNKQTNQINSLIYLFAMLWSCSCVNMSLYVQIYMYVQKGKDSERERERERERNNTGKHQGLRLWQWLYV